MTLPQPVTFDVLILFLPDHAFRPGIFPGFRHRHRLREIISLGPYAADLLQEFEVFPAFHSFTQRGNAHAPDSLNDVFHQCRGARIPVKASEEYHIELQHIDGNGGQHIQ